MPQTFAQGYAVVVGVGADLAVTVDDAIGVADLLQDPGRCAYPSQQVRLLTGEQAFETTGFYVLWAAVIMGPVTIASGAFSWWHNYGHKLTANFRDKLSFSAIYVVLGAIAVAIRTANPDALVERDSLGWVYVMLIMAQIVVVSILGRVGVNILFPPKR